MVGDGRRTWEKVRFPVTTVFGCQVSLGGRDFLAVPWISGPPYTDFFSEFPFFLIVLSNFPVNLTKSNTKPQRNSGNLTKTRKGSSTESCCEWAGRVSA